MSATLPSIHCWQLGKFNVAGSMFLLLFVFCKIYWVGEVEIRANYLKSEVFNY